MNEEALPPKEGSRNKTKVPSRLTLPLLVTLGLGAPSVAGLIWIISAGDSPERRPPGTAIESRYGARVLASTQAERPSPPGADSQQENSEESTTTGRNGAEEGDGATGLDDPKSEGKVRPHPDSRARDALHHELRRFAQIDTALVQEEFDEAERLLNSHERANQGDRTWSDWLAGYRIILDCQRDPGAASRSAGAAFVEHNQGSRLRRKVRRACLIE